MIVAMKSDKMAVYLNEWLTDHDRAARWLARRAGVSHTVVTDMTKGHVPKLDYLIAVEQAMGVEPGDLVDLAAQIAERSGINQRMVSKFSQGWKLFPPDLQRDYEEFFDSATTEEVIELFKDVIKTRRARGKQPAGDDALPDEEYGEPPKSSGRKPARLLRRAKGAS